MAIAGGWTEYSTEITSDARNAFDDALKDRMGVTYVPLAVAEQTVAGTNYCFFCNAKTADAYPINSAVIVCIRKPIEGPAVVTKIHDVIAD
jgi:hypothetical protein